MIVGVAFLNKENGLLCSLPKPNRHGDIIHALYQVSGKQVLNGEWTQGFVDDKGKFYNRHEGAAYVLEIGQEVTDYCKREYEGRTLQILFSEDLW